jgi:tRNA A-37 threonylcarbamoyl transferase component Bud32
MKVIGKGMTATVYSDNTFAYKKYHSSYSLENIDYEIKVQNEIYQNTKLKVSQYKKVDDMIQMTLFSGPTLAYKIRVENEIDWLSKFIDLQISTYEYHDLDLLEALPIYKKQIKSSKIDVKLSEKALDSLNKIKNSKTLCHFDFHPENIIYHQDHAYILDWTNAKLGNKTMDIASTYIIFLEHIAENANLYLREICMKTNVSVKEVKDALPLMAFIKLREAENNNDLLISLIDHTHEIYR